MKRKGKFYVYILTCKDGSYYTGFTVNIKKRLREHFSSKGYQYTKYKQAIDLVYLKEYRYYENAIKAEKRIKKLTRERKEGLISIYRGPC